MLLCRGAHFTKLSESIDWPQLMTIHIHLWKFCPDVASVAVTNPIVALAEKEELLKIDLIQQHVKQYVLHSCYHKHGYDHSLSFSLSFLLKRTCRTNEELIPSLNKMIQSLKRLIDVYQKSIANLPYIEHLPE